MFIHSVYFSFFKSYLFIIYLAAPGLSSAAGSFTCGMQTLSCGMWDIVPLPGIEPWASCIGSRES